jgi:hypothetical protein
MTVQRQSVWKTVKTHQSAHNFAYCDSFLWMDPRTLFAFLTGSLPTFTFYTSPGAFFA